MARYQNAYSRGWLILAMGSLWHARFVVSPILHHMSETRTLLIATMHGKETVIGPILEKEFGWACMAPEGFDTDRFGTFSGEVERELSPLEAAERKCLAAHELTGCDLVLASEGSFGPHPVIGFVPADEELLVLRDFEKGLTIRARAVSTDTNFGGQLCHHMREVTEFAERALFPSHALILRKDRDDILHLEKGISDPARLEKLSGKLLQRFGQVFVETDMRAMHNPTRQQVIAEATRKLAERIRCECPACGTPGYSVVESRSGLPCRECGFPTRSIRLHIYGCGKCGHRSEKAFPYGKEKEEALYCDRCNP